mmetsp:Transcript_30310/g.66655  ORF Transcript_30310/g.66655 Transcript_30310/m.66655 type:complete len:436 (-) Transcript_30310:89-1396(-)
MRRRRDGRSFLAVRNQCERSCSHTITSILAGVAFVPVVLSSRYPRQHDITTVLSANYSRGSIGSLPFGLRARGGYQDTADYDIDEAVAFRVFCVANFDDANVKRLQASNIDRLLSSISSSADEKESQLATGSEPEVAPTSDNVTTPDISGADTASTCSTTPIDVDSLVFGASKPGDGSESDPDGLPARFLRMQKGNRQHAKDAFVSTVQWRLQNKVDTILSRGHPKFDKCKAIFKHYFPGRDLSGNPIIVQQPGLLDLDLAHKENISMDDLLFHYVYVLEWCWNILEPGPPDGVMTSVVDMVGVGFRQVCNGEMRDFIQKSIGVISENYPQRSCRTLVINAPGWFGRLFKVIKPLLRESTREKIAIFNAGPDQDKALAQYLGEESIPAELLTGAGGSKKDTDIEFPPGPKSKIEHDLRDFALAVLDTRGEEMEKI